VQQQRVQQLQQQQWLQLGKDWGVYLGVAAALATATAAACYSSARLLLYNQQQQEQ
jgi:hypothetical protein